MIIALTGYKQAGKDSVAKTLIKEFGFTRYAFADVIRRCIGDIFLWSPEHMEKEKETIDPRWGVSPR
ncbi:MAG: hypothetical protein GY804_15630, partial [Alphaproteobacteria bacterium]|nr:hypothetical protein [Alphaproteobacteria bacterium]